MSASAGEHPNVTYPGRENVHPLFDPTRFARDIDYEAFYEPAVLATRLINSPQGLQHDYCFYFGKTVPAATPSDFVYEEGPRQLPYQYACDKAIGELTRADIKDVEKQRLLLADDITFIVDNDIPPYARCELAESDTGKRTSLIRISRSVYNAALAKKENSRAERTHQLASRLHPHTRGGACRPHPPSWARARGLPRRLPHCRMRFRSRGPHLWLHTSIPSRPNRMDNMAASHDARVV